MASPVEKVTIALKEFHEKIKSNIYNEVMKGTNVCSVINSYLPCDCILTVEKQDIKCHKVILQAVSTHLKEIFAMLPDEGISRLFIPDIKYKDVAALISIIYKGNIEITEEDFPGLQRCAKVLKVKLPEAIKDDEGNSELDHSGIIAINSCQTELDSSMEIVQQSQEVVEEETTLSKVQKLPNSNSKSFQRPNKLPVSKPQRTRKKRKSAKEDEEEEAEEDIPLKKAKSSPPRLTRSALSMNDNFCPFCNKKFVRISKTHISECYNNPNRTSIECTICGKDIKPSLLQHHMKSDHNVQLGASGSASSSAAQLE